MTITQNLEAYIRNGQIKEASEILSGIKINQIPVNELYLYAQFSIRVQNYLLALQILSKNMNDHRDGIKQISTEEMETYITALIKLGLFKNSKNLLQELNPTKNPRYHDLEARIAMAQWDYEVALKHCNKYLDTIRKDSYQHLVGKLNLAASLVGVESFEEAIESLIEIEKEAKSQNYKLILGNSYELLAQAHIKIGKYVEARDHLNSCMKVFGNEESIWSFYVKKWDFFMETYNDRDPKVLMTQGRLLLNEATQKSYYEDVREIERHLALCLGDDERLLRVYTGTPYTAYRKKLISKYQLIVPSTITTEFGPKVTESIIFDYRNYFKDQTKLLSCFEILMKDFFKPISLGFIFDHLYKDEFFDSETSPQRIYAIIRRVRESIPEKYKIDINHHNYGTQILFNKNIQLELSTKEGIVDSEKRDSVELRDHFKRNWFTTSDVAKLTHKSPTTAKRLIEQAKKNYKIEIQGKGRATRYRFK